MIDDRKLQNLNKLNLLDVRVEQFKRGDFEFITQGYSKDGEFVTHYKQQEALRLLTDNSIEEIVFGGAIGGGKTYLGANWLFFMCLGFPGTKWFIARNELGKLIESSFRTFEEVCRKFGFSGYNFNANKNYIKFDNGSMINLIEVKYKPSDPMFETLGSIEFTGGWIEEGSEIHEEGYKKLMERIGRWKNEEYDITRKIFITCNPKRNWLYERYYKPHIDGTLTHFARFLPALITDNVFLGQKYIDGVIRNYEGDKVSTERLIKGNWTYIENPHQLADQECIENIFENNHVPEGKTYITADIARHGSDKAVIIAWSGWIAKEIITYDFSSIPDIVNSIKFFKNKYRVPSTRTIVDADGIGSAVLDYVQCKGFRNNGQPIRKGRETPNYRNIQIQCLYLLAEKINEDGLYIEADITREAKTEIKEELAQIESVPNKRDDMKLDCKSKGEIKSDIKRSPDYRDALFMRVYFDLKRNTLDLTSNWN
jgi:hypothetical protein